MNHSGAPKIKRMEWKVDAATYARLEKIVAKAGFASVYELSQYVMSCFLRVADPISGVDDQSTALQELKDIWYNWQKPTARFTSTLPTRRAKMKMNTAIYLYTNENKETYIAEMITDTNGTHQVTQSVSKILDVVIGKLFPADAKKLNKIGREIDESSMIRILQYLMSESLPIESGAYAANEYGTVPCRSMSLKKVDDI